MEKFQYLIDMYFEECNRKKEEIGNEMNVRCNERERKTNEKD